MHIIRDIFSGITIAAALLFVGFLISLAWTNPTAPPPGGGGALITDSDYNLGARDPGFNPNFDPEYQLDVKADNVAANGFRATGIGNFVDKLIIGDPTINGTTPASKSKLHIVDGTITQDNPLNPVVRGGGNLTSCPPPPQVCVSPSNANAFRIEVQGRYAYLTYEAFGSSAFRIIDVTNPDIPVIVGGESITGLPGSVALDIAVSGKYAYVTFSDAAQNAFRIIDISNPRNPVVVGGQDLIQGMPSTANPLTIFVAGKYAYMTFASSGNNAFRIIDISDPAKPFVVGGASVSFTSNVSYGVYVSGRYAYVNLDCTGNCGGSSNSSSFRVIDVSNPTNPQVVGTTVSGNLPNAKPIDIYVSGRFAYVSFFTQPYSLQVIDISNPASPILVGRGDAGSPATETEAIAITGAGRYVYLGLSGGNITPLRIFDIADPTNPKLVGGYNVITPTNNLGIAISGRYVFMSFTQTDNNSFRIVDISGIEGVSGQYGSLETGQFQVRENAAIDNNLSVRGGLTVGGSILGSLDAAFGELLIRSKDSSGGSVKLFTKTATAQSGSCDSNCGSLKKCLAAFDVDSQFSPNCNTVPSIVEIYRCFCAGLGN